MCGGKPASYLFTPLLGSPGCAVTRQSININLCSTPVLLFYLSIEPKPRPQTPPRRTHSLWRFRSSYGPGAWVSLWGFHNHAALHKSKYNTVECCVKAWNNPDRWLTKGSPRQDEYKGIHRFNQEACFCSFWDVATFMLCVHFDVLSIMMN